MGTRNIKDIFSPLPTACEMLHLGYGICDHISINEVYFATYYFELVKVESTLVEQFFIHKSSINIRSHSVYLLSQLFTQITQMWTNFQKLFESICHLSVHKMCAKKIFETQVYKKKLRFFFPKMFNMIFNKIYIIFKCNLITM